jgi:hypothetical protein
MTRRYKAKLPKAQQKAFKARMWEFRQRPADLSPEEKEHLEEQFRRPPSRAEPR